jgi:GCN5-like protein 1 (GCN5L1)
MPSKPLQTSLQNIDKSLTATLQLRLTTIHSNDTNLTKQTKTLQARTHEARKQQDSWDAVVRAGRNGLKVSPTGSD